MRLIKEEGRINEDHPAGSLMDNKDFYVSICIPCYNRPVEIKRLLESVDASNASEIEIVITENDSPKRKEIRQTVEEVKKNSPYQIDYYENEENFGYDKNLRGCAAKAHGKWIIFMGDDDVFIRGSLDKYIRFLKAHEDLGYVLRRYKAEYVDGKVEEYRYDNKDVFFEPSVESYVELFRRSVFISGFTFRRECFQDYDCSDYDGTLLFQLYIEALVCMKYPSAYCDIPITKSIEGGTPYMQPKPDSSIRQGLNRKRPQDAFYYGRRNSIPICCGSIICTDITSMWHSSFNGSSPVRR